jgi:TonB family protein
MPPSDAVIRAEALDHQAQPTAPTLAERRGLALALIAAAALHLIVPAALLVYAAFFAPRPAPPLEEIPVELVQEEPPPKPEPKKDQPPPPPPSPDDERPAYDAPSAATQEKTNRESTEEKSQAPKSPAEPSQPAGAPEPSQREQASPQQTAKAPPPPAEAPPTPDADQPAAPTPTPSDADAAPPAPKTDPNPAPPPAPPSKAPPGAPLPEPMDMPEPKFAHAATESPVIGGNADTRYFTIVYGMIRKHIHEPPHPTPTRSGAVVFMVDEGGNLVDRRVVTSSGSPTLDMAVMAAIAEAAPYPAPPGWQPRGMRLTYGK